MPSGGRVVERGLAGLDVERLTELAVSLHLADGLTVERHLCALQRLVERDGGRAWIPVEERLHLVARERAPVGVRRRPFGVGQLAVGAEAAIPEDSNFTDHSGSPRRSSAVTISLADLAAKRTSSFPSSSQLWTSRR